MREMSTDERSKSRVSNLFEICLARRKKTRLTFGAARAKINLFEICLARRRTTQLTNGRWPKGKANWTLTAYLS